MSDRGDRSGSLGLAFHDGGIELGGAVARQGCPVPGIEQGVVLEHAYGGRHRVEARAASLQNVVSSIQRRLQALAKWLVARVAQGLRWDRSRAAVNGYCVHAPLISSSDRWHRSSSAPPWIARVAAGLPMPHAGAGVRDPEARGALQDDSARHEPL